MSTLQRYMDKRIKRCLANPAILVLALVYLSSAKRVEGRFALLGDKGPLIHFRASLKP